jgi:hypothetical protein
MSRSSSPAMGGDVSDNAQRASVTELEVESAKLQIEVLERLGRQVDERLRRLANTTPTEDQFRSYDRGHGQTAPVQRWDYLGLARAAGAMVWTDLEASAGTRVAQAVASLSLQSFEEKAEALKSASARARARARQWAEDRDAELKLARRGISGLLDETVPVTREAPVDQEALRGSLSETDRE